MAEKSYFFNDVNDDRVYLAEDFAMFFSTLIGNGVFPNPSTNTQVLVNEETPMSITIKPGFAWINGYMYWNPDNLVKTLAAAYTNPRIDRVVIRWSSNNREIRAEVITGTPAAVPVAPELTRNSDVWELGIADIFVGGGVTSIAQANITDTRLSNALCGIVHGVIDQVDTTTIFNQFQAWYLQTTNQATADLSTMLSAFQNSFNAWFATVQDILDENTAGNLLNMINSLIDRMSVAEEAILGLKTFQTAGGTGTTITLTGIELVDGFHITFVILASNSGAATTINTKPLYKPGTTIAPKLVAGKAATVWYNTAGGCFFIKASAEGTAVAGDVLASKTFSNDEDVGLAGTMPNNGAVTITPSTANQAIAAGYHNGNGVVAGDADLVAANILSGKNIFGVDGAVVGKKIATGTAEFVNGSNYVNITNLTFKPKTIFVSFDHIGGEYWYSCMYTEEFANFPYNNWLFEIMHKGTMYITGFTNISTSGFTFTDSSHSNWVGVNTHFKWYALG